MTIKYCPYCKHRIATLSIKDVGTSKQCDKCGKQFTIGSTLTDNRRCGHAGQFRLIKVIEPSINPDRVLTHLAKAQPTYAAKIAKKLGKPQSTIRACLHQLEAEGHIKYKQRGNYKYYSLSEVSA